MEPDVRTTCLDIKRALGHFGRRGNDDDWEAELGDQSHKATNHPRGSISNKKHHRILGESKLGRQPNLKYQITSAGKPSLHVHAQRICYFPNINQPDIRFSLETRPFQRESTIYKPRKLGHVPLSAASQIRKGTFGLLGTY